MFELKDFPVGSWCYRIRRVGLKKVLVYTRFKIEGHSSNGELLVRGVNDFKGNPLKEVTFEKKDEVITVEEYQNPQRVVTIPEKFWRGVRKNQNLSPHFNLTRLYAQVGEPNRRELLSEWVETVEFSYKEYASLVIEVYKNAFQSSLTNI